MKKLWFALLLLMPWPVFAQNANVAPSGCATAKLPGGTAALSQDAQGRLCVNGNGSNNGGSGSTTTQTNGTITVANTFQQMLPYTATRLGGTITNTSASDLEYVFLAAKATDCTTATIAASLPVGPQRQLLLQSTGGGPLTDEVCITGPSTSDTFVVTRQ